MKVCVLAAGKGSRSGPSAEILHKCLLPVGNKAVLSRIIDQFPPNSEFVIAVGFLSDQIRDFLKLAHPDLRVKFVQVDRFEGPGSGPGYSLYCCRETLQEPFVFTSCDTLINSDLPRTNSNWIGISQVNDIQNWCSVRLGSGNQVQSLYYKKPNVETNLAFTGIASVKNYGKFWDGMARESKSETDNEFQVNAGLLALVSEGLEGVRLEWKDTGEFQSYLKVCEKFGKNFSFPGKTTETTYSYGEYIIKGFSDERSAITRYERAGKNRRFASVLDAKGCFLKYLYQPGPVLTEYLDYIECTRFLEWAQQEFWRDLQVDRADFRVNSRRFYVNKTENRLERLCAFPWYNSLESSVIEINGLECAPALELVRRVSDSLISGGIASTYHGDLHSDNIIKIDSGYVFIDWRDQFGDLMDAGDRYYDLAKFLHTLEFSVKTMAHASAFRARPFGQLSWTLDHDCTFREIRARDAFWDFVAKYNYDANRIRIINNIIFLNMAPLYQGDLALYLYLLGRFGLQCEVKRELEEKRKL